MSHGDSRRDRGIPDKWIDGLRLAGTAPDGGARTDWTCDSCSKKRKTYADRKEYLKKKLMEYHYRNKSNAKGESNGTTLKTKKKK